MENKYILDGIIQLNPNIHNGRIYSADMFEKHFIHLLKSIKRKERENKIKRLFKINEK